VAVWFENPQGDIMVGRIQDQDQGLGLARAQRICRGLSGQDGTLHNPGGRPGCHDNVPAGSEDGIGVIDWAVGLAGMDVVVVGGRGVELGAGVAVDPTVVGLVGYVPDRSGTCPGRP
jgi:hypothetical protein